MFLRDLIRGFTMQGGKPLSVAASQRPPGVWPLNHAVAEFSRGDALTIGDCMMGVQVFGATGSGKTSGSLAFLARAMMRDRWGMLILTTKTGEAEQWIGWAKASGREKDVLRIRPDGQHYFNFLEYLNRHPDPGASIPTNIADLLMTLASHAKPKSQASETSEFFMESASQMVIKAIHLLRAADEPLSLRNIGNVISSAPTHKLELKDKDVEDRYVSQLIRRAEKLRPKAEIESLCQYWLHQYAVANERTRGDVIATLSSVIFRFTEAPFADLIASDRGNNYLPELVDTGQIMILDAPVIRYKQAGRLYQIAMKLLVQDAVLRRPNTDTTRPVVIFADEAQNFATHADHKYQAICRDFRGCTVYATQTIDNYREAVGSSDAVEALLASLVTKIFHANAGQTNKWAQELIANDWRMMASESLNQRGEQHNPSFGRSQSEQLHPQVLAAEFTRLRNGGDRNGALVDAIVFQPGRAFHQSGKPLMRAVFQQGRR